MMRKNRILIVSVLVLALALGLCLTACGGDETVPDKKVTFSEKDLASIDALYSKIDEALSEAKSYTLDTLMDGKVIQHYCLDDVSIMNDTADVVEYFTGGKGQLRVIMQDEGKWYYQDRQDTFESFVQSRKAAAAYVYDKTNASNGAYDSAKKALTFDYLLGGIDCKVTVTLEGNGLLFNVVSNSLSLDAKLYDVGATKVTVPTPEGAMPKEHEKYVTITPSTAKPFEGVDRSDLYAIIMKTRELAAKANYAAIQNNCNQMMAYRYCTKDAVREVMYGGLMSSNTISVPLEKHTQRGDYTKEDGKWSYNVENLSYERTYALFEISMSLFDAVTDEATYRENVFGTTYDEATHTISAEVMYWFNQKGNITVHVTDDLKSVVINVDMGGNMDNVVTYTHFGEVAVNIPDDIKALSKDSTKK